MKSYFYSRHTYISMFSDKQAIKYGLWLTTKIDPTTKNNFDTIPVIQDPFNILRYTSEYVTKPENIPVHSNDYYKHIWHDLLNTYTTTDEHYERSLSNKYMNFIPDSSDLFNKYHELEHLAELRDDLLERLCPERKISRKETKQLKFKLSDVEDKMKTLIEAINTDEDTRREFNLYQEIFHPNASNIESEMDRKVRLLRNSLIEDEVIEDNRTESEKLDDIFLEMEYMFVSSDDDMPCILEGYIRDDVDILCDDYDSPCDLYNFYDGELYDSDCDTIGEPTPEEIEEFERMRREEIRVITIDLIDDVANGPVELLQDGQQSNNSKSHSEHCL